MRNRYAALCFDLAVVHFGIIIDNAAQEMVDVGTDKEPKWVNKYHMADLLTPGFIIGRDGCESGDGLRSLVADLRGVDGIAVDTVRA